MLSSKLLLLVPLASIVSALSPRQNVAISYSQNLSVVDTKWDGHCLYPKGDDEDFKLEKYLGRWYQLAGTAVPFTAGCSCVYADYSLNSNGTVAVSNGCQLAGRNITIQGTATPSNEIYGAKGVFKVKFPFGSVDECPGPNYIVQDYADDWAIVQAANFSTLFVLSRHQNVSQADISAWTQRAGTLGSDLSNVIRFNQTDCLFT